MYKYSKNYFYLKGIKNQQPKSTKNRYFFEQILMTIFEHPTRNGNYLGGCKAMYGTLLEDVWLSDIGRMAEVRNVPHLACKV